MIREFGKVKNKRESTRVHSRLFVFAASGQNLHPYTSSLQSVCLNTPGVKENAGEEHPDLCFTLRLRAQVKANHTRRYVCAKTFPSAVQKIWSTKMFFGSLIKSERCREEAQRMCITSMQQGRLNDQVEKHATRMFE